MEILSSPFISITMFMLGRERTTLRSLCLDCQGDWQVFDFTHIGKLLIVVGLLTAGIGIVLLLSDKIPWLGRLPGDFLFEGKHSSFYFPLTTSILISVVITLILWFINRR